MDFRVIQAKDAYPAFMCMVLCIQIAYHPEFPAGFLSPQGKRAKAINFKQCALLLLIIH